MRSTHQFIQRILCRIRWQRRIGNHANGRHDIRMEMQIVRFQLHAIQSAQNRVAFGQALRIVPTVANVFGFCVQCRGEIAQPILFSQPLRLMRLHQIHHGTSSNARRGGRRRRRCDRKAGHQTDVCQKGQMPGKPRLHVIVEEHLNDRIHVVVRLAGLIGRAPSFGLHQSAHIGAVPELRHGAHDATAFEASPHGGRQWHWMLLDTAQMVELLAGLDQTGERRFDAVQIVQIYVHLFHKHPVFSDIFHLELVLFG